MHVVPLAYGDPVQLFRAFADDPVAALLHSAAPDAARGRYSYIAVEPYQILRADSAGTSLDGYPVPGDPFAVLAQVLARHALPTPPDAPVPFVGGAVGFLSYELGRHVERLPAPRPGPPVPDLLMGLYDVVLAFDHAARAAWLISSGLPEQTEADRARRAEARAAAVLARITPLAPEASLDWGATARWTPDLDRTEMEARIARAVDYIHAGDIFQANITQIFRAPRPEGLSDYNLYRRLTALSPAPFSALLTGGPDLAVISASPERFLHLSADGAIETRPIKGTRPRGADPQEDARLASELRDSAKDRAENLMIVDLMRNDLGRVSRLGSVEVPQLCVLETFASVHHLVSEVRAQLQPGLVPVDLLRASFPGGSITGAPKVRAMEIIHELEPSPRGVYCGAIAWIGFDGAMDSSIVIRTLTRTGDTLMAQAGGGIVADSDPAAEYEESLIKMQPLLRAVTGDAA